ncbi:MAG: MaoC family dehydratase N-terminal domain-containing protein [Candidatus Binatia bacterium]
MAERFELSDEMRAQVGRESSPYTLEVTTTSVRAFARGVGYRDPVYFDIEAARRAGYPNLPAPPTYLGTPIFIPGQSDERFSWPVAARLRIDHGLKGLLDGGTETEYFEQIFAGDTLTAVSRLAALDVRSSPTLGKMLLMTTEVRFSNQDGKLVAMQRGQTIFY